MRVGFGIIIRNSESEGEIMVSYCDQFSMVTQPVMAESIALWKAMGVCADLGFNKIIFEGDAQAVIHAVKDPEEN